MKCASWGKWRSDTVIRSLGHIVRKICPRKTCPLRTGKGLFPTFSVTPARSAAAPFLLLSSRRHLGVHSVCRRRLFPEPPLVLCAIFSVDTCIHRSEVSADYRFSAIFLCPKQHRQQGALAVLTPLLRKLPFWGPSLTAPLCWNSLFPRTPPPARPSFPAAVRKHLSNAQPEVGSPVWELVLLVTWKPQTPGEQRDFPCHLLSETGFLFFRASDWFCFLIKWSDKLI